MLRAERGWIKNLTIQDAGDCSLKVFISACVRACVRMGVLTAWLPDLGCTFKQEMVQEDVQACFLLRMHAYLGFPSLERVLLRSVQNMHAPTLCCRSVENNGTSRHAS